MCTTKKARKAVERDFIKKTFLKLKIRRKRKNTVIRACAFFIKQLFSSIFFKDKCLHNFHVSPTSKL